MRMCRNSICSLFEAFLCVPWVWTCSVVRGGVSSLSRQFSPPLPSLFPLFIQCDGCLFPFPVWGLTAGLPGFAGHGRSLHLGAGCQLWKLLDVLGTQPPLNDAVVKSYFFTNYGVDLSWYTVHIIDFSEESISLFLLQNKLRTKLEEVS